MSTLPTLTTQPLLGKTAVVTGASRGIGRAIALHLAGQGAAVVVNFARSEAEAAEVVATIRAAGGRAEAIQADLGVVAEIDTFFTRFDAVAPALGGSGKIDILVNNAGIAPFVDLEGTDEATYDRVFDVNVKGVFFTVQKALPRLADGGRVINLSSAVARTFFPGLPAYSATKGAINTLTIHLAGALAARGITVNAVAPGAIDTDMSAWVRTDEGAATVHQMQALQRIGTANDIAAVVAFLASPAGGWVTGQVVEASGGTKL